MFLLWKDKKAQELRAARGRSVTRDSNVWLRLMLVAFVANGIGPFGLKILSERGLASQYQAQYLLYWYLGGFMFAMAALWRSGLRPTAARWDSAR